MRTFASFYQMFLHCHLFAAFVLQCHVFFCLWLRKGAASPLPASWMWDREVPPYKTFLFLPSVFYHWTSKVIYNLGRFIYPLKFPLHGHRSRCKQETLINLGKDLCRPKGAPVSEAVDGIGGETVVHSLAFCQGWLRCGTRVILLEDHAQVFLEWCEPMWSLWPVGKSNQSVQMLGQPLLRHLHLQCSRFRAVRMHIKLTVQRTQQRALGFRSVGLIEQWCS